MPTPPDRRSAMAAAFTEHEDEPAELDPAADAPEVVDEPEPAAEPDHVEVQDAGEKGAEPLGDVDAEGDRDEKGRFKPKKGAAADPATPAAAAAQQLEGEADQEPQPVAPAGPELKAPSSWKPAVREQWSKLPADVRAEVVRVDREVRRVQEQAAGVRRELEVWGKTVEPFAPLIRQAQAARGEDYNPLPVIGSLLRTAAQLQLAPMDVRGKIVADLINSHSIPLEVVNKFLGGEQPAQQGQPPAQGAQPQQFRDPRLDELLGTLQAQRQHSQQRLAQETNQEIESFGEQHEFFGDVRRLMGTLMADAAEAGQPMTMQEAYDQATWAHPQTRKVIEQRAKVKAATTKVAATQRSRNAASSIRSSPTGAGPEQEQRSRRSSIQEAWDESDSR